MTTRFPNSRRHNPILLLRGGSVACAIILGLSLTVFKDGPHHAFCVGLALGLLVGVAVTSFQIRSIEITDDTQPSGTRLFPAP